MKILLAGQLDRVFANEFTVSVGLDPDGPFDQDVIEEQRSADERYFHQAGTLAALSDEVLSLPYVRYAADSAVGENFRDSIEAAMSDHTKSSRFDEIISFDAVADDALDLVRVCVLIGQLSPKTDQVVDDVDMEEAWIGHYHALKHLHGDHGVPLAYLAGLLMQAFHAWNTGAVLVLAECDRFALADLGAIIVRKRWPRPFAIPDLRHMGPPYSGKRCGSLLNLRPTDIADVEALKREPGIRAYAEAVSEIVSGAETEHVGSALAKASRSVRSINTLLPNEHQEISLFVANARIFNNAGTMAPGGHPARDIWSRRRFPTRPLRTIVLS